MTDRDKGELRKHYASWQFSQFLHGEQGAMVCAARIIVGARPGREVLLGHPDHGRGPPRRDLRPLPAGEDPRDALPDQRTTCGRSSATPFRDSRWDMPYLGMQVLIEGLALAAFGMIRDTTDSP